MNIHQAHVIKASPYQENKILVTLLTQNLGLISGVVSGGVNVSGKKLVSRSVLQLGENIECQIAGNGNLKKIYSVETLSSPQVTHAIDLVVLGYAAEITLHCLPEEHVSPSLYESFSLLIDHVAQSSHYEASLRLYESVLLGEIGIHFDFLWDAEKDQAIEEGVYTVTIDDGVRLAREHESPIFSKTDLESLSVWDYKDTQTLRLMKYLHRSLFKQLMNGKPLKSRELFRQLNVPH